MPCVRQTSLTFKCWLARVMGQFALGRCLQRGLVIARGPWRRGENRAPPPPLPTRGRRLRVGAPGAPHGSSLGTTRWVVERTFAWLHQFKRLRTRHERRADLHRAFLTLGCCVVCARML